MPAARTAQEKRRRVADTGEDKSFMEMKKGVRNELLFLLAHIVRAAIRKMIGDYLLENWLALLAFLRPGFLRSFILGSLVRKPAALRAGL